MKGDSMNDRNARTYADLYGPAMTITTQAEADACLESLVDYMLARPSADYTREAATAMVRQNLGYYAGYYGSDTRARVERLFKCAHPVFGAIAERGQPTPAEAYAAGVRLADERAEAQRAANRANGQA